MRLGALEAGGTKMVCSIGDENGQVFQRISIPTKQPIETMPLVIDFFKDKEIEALGIGSFGPLDLDRQLPTYGNITSTPKKGWKNYPLLTEMKKALGIPCAIDTDVNAAALAESRMGAGKGMDNVLYVTIGTGVGGGIVSMGNMVHGLVHPEVGHMLLRPAQGETMKRGVCPYHSCCLEGLAAGPAIEARCGIPAYDLPENHWAWKIEAEYLAQMCVNVMMVLSPEIIILGGGVMQQMHLFEPIRKRTLELLGGYIDNEKVTNRMNEYIVSPGLGINSGVIGALLMAAEVIND